MEKKILTACDVTGSRKVLPMAMILSVGEGPT